MQNLKILSNFLIAVCCCVVVRANEDSVYNLDRSLAGQPLPSKEISKTFKNVNVKIEGLNVHYLEGGTGAPVVLLHGWPGHWKTWGKIMPRLAAEYRVYVFDLPGFGESQPVADFRKTKIAEFFKKIFDSIGLTKFHLVGHDMGFIVAFAYASLFPEDINSLIALDTILPGFELASGKEKDLLVPTVKRNLWYLSFFMATEYSTQLLKNNMKWFLNEMLKQNLYNRAAISPKEREELLNSMTRNNNLESSLKYYSTFLLDAEDNKKMAIKKISKPILIGLGESSFLRPEALNSIKSVGTKVTEKIISRSGHFVIEERPAYVSQLISDFITSNSQKN